MMALLYPTECVAPYSRPPPHFCSLTFPSSSLLARKCQQLLGSLGLRVWPPSSAWAPPASTSWTPPGTGIAVVVLSLGLLLTFLLVKSNFQTQERNTNRKSWTWQWQSNPRPRSRMEEWYLTVYVPLPWPLLTNINSRWTIKSPVFLLLFFFYSALQALCFMFPIAPPEINQSNTCSRSLGRWRRPFTLLAVPRRNSCAVLVQRYVSAGLSYREGKTIIVVFCCCCFLLASLFFSFLLSFSSPGLSFVFLGSHPQYECAYGCRVSSLRPSASCVCMLPDVSLGLVWQRRLAWTVGGAPYGEWWASGFWLQP